MIGAWDSGKDGGDTPFKVKAFAIKHGINEDPVYEILNASKAQWLIRSSLAPKSYVAANVVLGRDSRIYVDQIDDTLLDWGSHCIEYSPSAVALNFIQ